MKKILFFVLVVVCLKVVGTEPDINVKQVGRFDATRDIDGVLFDKNEFTTFKNGKLSGPSLYINRRDSDKVYHVLFQMFYVDNILQGSCLGFYPNGVVSEFLCNIKLNIDYHEVRDYFPYQSYCYKFYDTGTIKAEGWGLIEESIMLGNSIMIGKWKYYDSNGKLEKEVEYPKEINGIDGRWLFD